MDLSLVLGAPPFTYLVFTAGLVGWVAWMTGQALAATWRPLWQALPYGVLLAAANRFFLHALFGGTLLSASGFVIDVLLLIAFAALAYRLTHVHKMVTQYPWLFERTGLFGWREKGNGA
ncbi:DUF6867 family protein [Pararhodospirillum oryzae]|uniref:DUF6867 domain-containing protein n=1 Tax=Pararhodospirillum oryzae TaxID=478448 RepID=A0A512H9K5_9PROT|nr:hypothetical protein [Pararhodospirillum oryzae]GEO82131.1 hypothetical protein ROR02_22620 [Pararhodospirillum oryzae]